MQTRWKVAIALGCAGVALFAWGNADWNYWYLSNNLPTSKVEESRQLGVFERRVKVVPIEFELAGKRHRIANAWLEHRATPRKVTPFFTRLDRFPELILCVDVDSGATSNVWIKGGRDMGVNGVRFLDVGRELPGQFTLRTHSGDAERTFEIEEQPDQSPRSTSG